MIPVKLILLFTWIKNDRLKFNDSISQYQYAMLHQLVMFACASVLVKELLWTDCRMIIATTLETIQRSNKFKSNSCCLSLLGREW